MSGSIKDAVQKVEAAAGKERFDCDEQGNKMPQAKELLRWVAKRMLFGFEDLLLLDRDMLGIVIDRADYIAISLNGAPDALLQTVPDEGVLRLPGGGVLSTIAHRRHNG